MGFIKFVDKLNEWMEKLAGLALGAMTVIVFYQVIARSVLGNMGIIVPASWSEEIARYLMIWMIFIGGAVAARKSKLIAVETLAHFLPAMIGKTIKYIAHLISISFYITIFFIGLSWIEFGSVESAPVTGIPMTLVYSSMAVGAFMMAVNTVTLILESILLKTDIRYSSGGEDIS